jgi:hypothetical protein
MSAIQQPSASLGLRLGFNAERLLSDVDGLSDYLQKLMYIRFLSIR